MAHGFLLILLFSHIISTNAHACNQTERASLMSFASTLCSRPLNWTSVNCCHWKGITCNQDGLVTHLLLSSKGLKGAISPSSPSLGNLKHLTHLNLSHNSLSGSLEFLLSLYHLEVLDLSFNLLSGKLPFSLPSHNIQMLDLSSNRFHGAIPSSFFQQARNLTSFNVHNNSFSGSRITGPIPRSLGTLPKLFYLTLADNQISGEFPKELCGLLRLVHEELNTTQVDDYIDLPIFTPTNLIYSGRISSFPPTLNLAHNCIHGRIPTEIGQIHLVHYLYLSDNCFSGNIPEQISNLKNLEGLGLSMNQLSGNIPLSFVSLSFLKYFNVSYNNLEGPIPTATQLQTFNASAFEGNSKLCGSPLPNECLPTKGIDADGKNNQGVDSEHQFPWLYIFTALGFIVGFWGVCGSLIVKKTWRYSYFKFLDNVQYRLHVKITVLMTMMKRRLRGD